MLDALELMPYLSAIVIILAIVVAVIIVPPIVQRARRKKFKEKYRISLTKDYLIKENPKPQKGNHFVLDFPIWLYANKDGTADRRRNGNNINCEPSVLYLDDVRVSIKDPIALSELVKLLRLKGVIIQESKEEKLKRKYVLQEKTEQLCLSSIEAIVQQFFSRPTDFEEYCARMYRDFGYSAKTTPPSRDGGYDIIAIKDSETTIVECKLYSKANTVGRNLVQKLVGANQAVHAQHMTFITTSGYSRDAQKYARETGVTLIDGNALLKLRNSLYGTHPQKPMVTIQEVELTREDLLSYFPEDYQPT